MYIIKVLGRITRLTTPAAAVVEKPQ